MSTSVQALKRIRIDRLLSSQGLCSRHEAREIINQGRVRVEGVRVRGPAQTVEARPGIHFRVDLSEYQYHPRLYVMCYKPEGYECSHRSKHHQTVFELLPSYWLRRSYSAMNACGRLPVNNTGLVFCSDDGRFSHHITNPSKGLLRTYQFDFTEPLPVEKMKKFQEGVVLDNVPGKLTHFEDVKQISELRWQMSILNDNLIKPMMVAVDVYLIKIHRIGIGSIFLPDHIKPGEWAYIDDDDLSELGYVYESKTDFTPRQERSLEKDPTSDPAKLYNKFWSKHRVRGDEYLDLVDRWDW